METHHIASQATDLHINGYQNFSVCRKKNKNKASGGLVVYVRKEIRPGVSKIPRGGTESICLKLKKEFFGLTNDIFLV